MRSERLWTVHQGGRRLQAELRDRGGLGVELQLQRDGAFFSGRRFKLRRHAITFGDILRERLETEGWIRIGELEDLRI